MTALDLCYRCADSKDSIAVLSSDGTVAVIVIEFEDSERTIRRIVCAEVKLVVLTACRTLKSFRATSDGVSFAVGGIEKIRLLRYSIYPHYNIHRRSNFVY